MPLYEFECEDCGVQIELLLKAGEAPSACSSCGAKKLKKLVSASAFHLKGSGWYKTDYASSGAASSNSSSGNDSSEDKKKDNKESKSDSLKTVPSKSSSGGGCGGGCSCH